MLTKYVVNWYAALLFYLKILKHTTVKFKDGMEMRLSEDDLLLFYEELYIRHLKDHGFHYIMERTATSKRYIKEERKSAPRRYIKEKGILYDVEGKNIIHTPGGLKLNYSQIPYSFVLDEVFVMKVYGQNNLSGRTVIDVGAYYGESTLYFAQLGASKVYAFEADLEYYNTAQENIKLNNLTDKINLIHEEATSSALKNLINEHGLTNIFLKIDCEGCEHELIGNAGSEIFEHITDIALEYEGPSKAIIERLLHEGFTVKRKKEIITATKKTVTKSILE
jgi:hypothetical protein